MSFQELYSKDSRKNKEQRLNILQKADTDKEIPAYFIEACSRGIDGMLLWFNLFAWTYNPRLDGEKYVPFIPYAFQEEKILKPLHDKILTAKDGETLGFEKARDMGATWCILGVFFYFWLFYENFDFLVGSRKEEYVDKKKLPDTLFGKLDIMLRLLPRWMRPQGMKEEHNTHCALVNPEKRSLIRGESSNQDFSRSGRYRAVLMDELAFWDCAQPAYSAASESCNLIVPVSTPNPEGSGYFQTLVTDPKHKFIRLEHSLHPHKNSEWLDNQRKIKSDEVIAVEILLDYAGAITGKVYGAALKCEVDDKFDYDASLELYRSWDFGHGGNDPTAILWFQKGGENGDQVRLIDWYQCAKDDIGYFVPVALGARFAASGYVYEEEVREGMERRKYWREAMDYGDPYSARTKVHGTSVGCTIAQELAKKGVNVITNEASHVAERIEKTRLMMKRMVVHPRALPALELIAQARFPQRGEHSQATNISNLPVHDHTSHVRTALEYFADNEPSVGGRVIVTYDNLHSVF